MSSDPQARELRAAGRHSDSMAIGKKVARVHGVPLTDGAGRGGPGSAEERVGE